MSVFKLQSVVWTQFKNKTQVDILYYIGIKIYRSRVMK